MAEPRFTNLDKPEGKYTMIRNEAIYDPRLSLKALGMLVLMRSRPPDWQFHLKELEKHSRDGRDSVRSAVNELVKLGYVRAVQTRREGGKFGSSDYSVTDRRPVAGETVAGKPVYGKTVDGEPATSKTDLTKTDLTKTDSTKTKDSEKPKAKAKAEKFDPLKVELPDNVPPELWAEFVAHRSEIKKKLTPTATKQLLTRLRGFGPSAETALRDSIANGWTGVFPPKDKPGTKTVEDDAGILDQYKELGL